jgi:outer membrane lipoprotein SlyB
MSILEIAHRAACVALALSLSSGPALADLMIYPKAKQSAEQQSKDKYECHEWAVQQTGFNPMKTTSTEPPPEYGRQPNAVRGAARGAAAGAVVGAVAGDAGKGAAAGAAGGALVGGVRRRDQQIARDQQRAANEAAVQDQRGNYDRAVKTCLEARNYSVN